MENNKVYRNGVELVKGAILTTSLLDEFYDMFTNMMNDWVSYPDLFLDSIAAEDCPIHFFPYQRMLLRACIRYRYVFCTATRAFSKSFCAILALYLRCIFIPHSKVFICSDIKGQSIRITKQKLDEIWAWWPLLKNELLKDNMGGDYIELTYKNGSTFFIVTMSSAGRGTRSTGGVLEEAAKLDGQIVSEVIIPQMNVIRRNERGLVNPYEPQPFQCYVTSAGQKNSYAYERLIELTVMSIIKPSLSYVCGFDYRLPVYHKLLSKDYLEEQRLSPTFSTESFARRHFCASLW
jgi:hypothetical protein